MNFTNSDIIERIGSRLYPREAVSDLLVAYNRGIAADAAALSNAAKLAEGGSLCVVTGQQLGLMGGPVYTVLKAISTLLLARAIGAVPLFWLATEDHDIAEIDHTYLLSERGDLKKFQIALPRDGRAVEDLMLSEQERKQIAAFAKETGAEAFVDFEERNYSRAMAGFLAKMFAGTGLVFLEPKLLRPFARRFFKKELSASSEIGQLLREGPKGPLTFPENDTNLFLKDEKLRRQKVRREKEGYSAGEERFTEAGLLELIEKSPDRFSPNAAARPLLQSSLLPTAAYVAGPTEWKYLKQLEEYHRYHRIPAPIVVPRLSATFVTPDASRYLKGCGLKPDDRIPGNWEERYPFVAKEKSAKERKKLLKEYAASKGLPAFALHYLHNFLRPHGELQERTLNFWEFQSKTSKNLIYRLLEGLSWPYPTDHRYVEIADE